MNMLPNEHHPGPRCSCAVCVNRYASALEAASDFKDDPFIKREFNYEGTLDFIRNVRDKSIYIAAAQSFRYKDGTHSMVRANIKVPKTEALRFIENAYLTSRVRAECMIIVWELSSCVFIGMEL
jgi:hypothetical protein